MPIRNVFRRLRRALPVILAGAPVLVDLFQQIRAALRNGEEEEAPAAGETA